MSMGSRKNLSLDRIDPIETRIFPRSHARFTLHYFHIYNVFTELQFHCYPFIILYHMFTSESCSMQETCVIKELS